MHQNSTIYQYRDILVIGGGPSGLSTALHLVKSSPELARRILVLEKGRYPRPKLCAGGLVADAEVILQRLGLDVSEVPHVDTSVAHFDFGGKGLKISTPGRHTLRIIRRDEFDTWLAGKAQERGITIQEGVTVKVVHPDRDGVTVETDGGTYRVQVVVGADGSNGVTRRSILPDTPVHTARLLEVITPQKNNPGSIQHGSSEAYFDFFCVPQGIAGYVWDFPTQIKGQPSRCWGIYDSNLQSNSSRPPLKSPLAEEMARHGLNLEEYDLKGHPIRWFSPNNPVSVPRVLLVGDAAGADPLFGEGISLALGYGQVAAQAIQHAFLHDNFSFDGYKKRVIRSPLGQTLATRWLITQVIYRLRWKWLQRAFWRRMGLVTGLVAWLFVLNWGKRMK